MDGLDRQHYKSDKMVKQADFFIANRCSRRYCQTNIIESVLMLLLSLYYDKVNIPEEKNPEDGYIPICASYRSFGINAAGSMVSNQLPYAFAVSAGRSVLIPTAALPLD